MTASARGWTIRPVSGVQSPTRPPGRGANGRFDTSRVCKRPLVAGPARGWTFCSRLPSGLPPARGAPRSRERVGATGPRVSPGNSGVVTREQRGASPGDSGVVTREQQCRHPQGKPRRHHRKTAVGTASSPEKNRGGIRGVTREKPGGNPCRTSRQPQGRRCRLQERARERERERERRGPASARCVFATPLALSSLLPPTRIAKRRVDRRKWPGRSAEGPGQECLPQLAGHRRHYIRWVRSPPCDGAAPDYPRREQPRCRSSVTGAANRTVRKTPVALTRPRSRSPWR